MGMLAGKRDSLRKNIFGVLSFMEKRSSFSSRIGFVLAVGQYLAVSLSCGKIWRRDLSSGLCPARSYFWFFSDGGGNRPGEKDRAFGNRRLSFPLSLCLIIVSSADG